VSSDDLQRFMNGEKIRARVIIKRHLRLIRSSNL
jgi:hypothetical protein